MKKLTLLCIAAVCTTAIGYSQFKMDASGHIGLGGLEPSSSYILCVENTRSTSISCTNLGLNRTPTSSYRIDIGGTGRLYNSYNNHIIFDAAGGYYAASIRPANNNTCDIGNASKAFKNVYAYNYPSVSDGRQKENIREIKKPLDLVLAMRGVKYDLKKEVVCNAGMLINPEMEAELEKERKDYYGFIAQELEAIAPELTNHDDSTDVYTVNYMQVIPILVEAIREQQAMIVKLEERINEKETDPKEKSAGDTDLADPITCSLEQNRPNPFTESTEIECYLSEDTREAAIYIYDMNGTQLRSFPLHRSGYNRITLNGGELNAGMYRYALIADGDIIATRNMVLTR